MAIKCPECQHENPDDRLNCEKCSAPLETFEEESSATKTLETPVKGLTSGTTFASRYEVIEELGKGGMGKVYKALDKEINEEVAIKLILICMEKERERRYQTASELLSDIQNIQEGIPLGERKVPTRKKKLRKEKSKIHGKKVLLYGAVPLLIVLIIAGAIYLYTTRAATIDSIAVLPFENLTGDPEQEYIGDWITDELIGKLARVGTLRVISYRTMRRYKGSEKSLPEIAQELNVDAVVTGTVQQAGANMSIRVQLIDALPEERSLWHMPILQKHTSPSPIAQWPRQTPCREPKRLPRER